MHQIVLRTCKNLLDQIPTPLDLEQIQQKVGSDPLSIVLIQEIERYNSLLKIVRNSLENLMMSIQGLIVISPEIEAVCQVCKLHISQV